MPVLATVAIVLAVVLLPAGVAFYEYGLAAFFAPKMEAVRRDTMIQSRAYSEATLRALYSYKRQYEQAGSDAERATIAAAARHEFEIFDKDRLPSDLVAFMSMVER